MQIAGRMAEVAMGEEFEFLFQKLIAVPLEMTGSHLLRLILTGDMLLCWEVDCVPR